MKYIIIKSPELSKGAPVKPLYYITTKQEIQQHVEDYFNCIYPHTNEYGPVQVFRRIVIDKQPHTYIGAIRKCAKMNTRIKCVIAK